MAGGVIYGDKFRASDADGFQMDGVAIGYSWISVRVATTADVVDLAAGAPLNVDGEVLVAGDRVGVVSQVNPIQNGIYRVVTPGVGADGAWVRTNDADESGEFVSGKFFYVQDGATWARMSFQLVALSPITLGVTPLVFNSFGGSSASLENVIYVDKGVDPTQDGSITYPYHTIAAAVTAASAGDTIWIMPGSYTETGLVSKASVTWQGIGAGQVVVTGAGVVLAITHTSRYRNIYFTVTDAAAIMTIAGAITAEFYDCVFSMNGNNANAIAVSGGATVVLEDCNLEQTAANLTALTVDATAGNIISMKGGSSTGVFTALDGTLSMEGVGLTGSVSHTGTAALTIFRSDITGGAIAVSHSATGAGSVVILQGNMISGSTYAVHATASPTIGILEDNLLIGTSGDFAADTATITYTSVQGNTTGVGFVQVAGGIFKCASATTKNVGGNQDAWATIAHGVIAASVGDKIVVHPGTYVESAIALTNGILVSGVARELVTVNAGVATGAFTVSAAIGATIENMSITGSLDVNGNGAVLSGRNLNVVGMIDVQVGDATTIVRMQDCKFVGDVTDHVALNIASANPFMYFDHCYLQGNVADAQPAIYYANGVTNDNLYLQGGCVVAHGSLAANPPFARSAAQTPAYHSHHSTYNTDPNNPPGPGFMVNQVPLGDQYDSFHAACVYWVW